MHRPALMFVALSASAYNSLQELPRFGHDESETVEVIQYLEQLISLKCRHGIRQLPALPERCDEVFARFLASLPRWYGLLVRHAVSFCVRCPDNYV